MQYTQGLIAATNGSATITGINTLWAANITNGFVFKRQSDDVFYDILAVVSDTEITLASAYTGSNTTGAPYAIIRDFTYNFEFPTVSRGDVNWPEIVSQALKLIDDNLYETQATKTVKSITFEPLTSTPDASEGILYYDDDLNQLVFWNGSAWRKITATAL